MPCCCGEMGEFEFAPGPPKYELLEELLLLLLLLEAELVDLEEAVADELLLLLVPMCGMTICSSC